MLDYGDRTNLDFDKKRHPVQAPGLASIRMLLSVVTSTAAARRLPQPRRRRQGGGRQRVTEERG